MRLRWIGLLLCLLSVSGGWAQDSPQVPELTETFADEDGSFTLNYPADWEAQAGYGQIRLGNSERAIGNGFEDKFEPGDVQIIVFGAPLADLVPGADLPAEADVEEVAAYVIELAAEESEEPVNFSEVDTTSVNDQPAAGMTFTRSGSDGYALIIDAEDDIYIAFQMLTAPHELSQWLPTALAIAETVMIQHPEPMPELTESFTLPDESFTIRYPEGWVAREGSPNGVDIASSEEALDLKPDDEFAPGDVRMFVGSGSPDELFDGLDITSSSPVKILRVGIEMNDDEDATYSEPEAMVINDRQAASTFVSQSNLEGYVVIIRYTENMYVVAYVQAAPGESERWHEVLLNMLHML